MYSLLDLLTCGIAILEEWIALYDLSLRKATFSANTEKMP